MSTAHYAIGIDIAKDTFELTWYHTAPAQAGAPSQTFANTQAGCEAAHHWLHAHGVSPAASHLVMEATGVYWEACALFFHQQHYRVSVVNPARVHAFAWTTLRRGKTDPLDADLLARFALTLQPEPWTPPPVEMEHLQQLMRQREAYVHLRSQVKNQLHAVQHHAHPCPEVVTSVHRTLTMLDQEIATLDRPLKRRCVTSRLGRRC
jgi:transposase